MALRINAPDQILLDDGRFAVLRAPVEQHGFALAEVYLPVAGYIVDADLYIIQIRNVYR